jgi:beta-1,4-mannooligosaccharide/beta-1,4-mannosyl-N-acetylglucosamine phosphorylase
MRAWSGGTARTPSSYYGAADTYLAVAYTRLEALIAHLKANSELLPGDAEAYR